jgi:hypothetical protein
LRNGDRTHRIEPLPGRPAPGDKRGYEQPSKRGAFVSTHATTQTLLDSARNGASAWMGRKHEILTTGPPVPPSNPFLLLVI